MPAVTHEPRRLLTALFVAAFTIVSIGLGANPASAEEVEQVEAPPASAPAALSTGSGIDDSIVRLYVAFFDRRPDANGLAHWGERYRRGERLAAIADRFVGSEEFQSRYGGLDHGAFVSLIYRNVLDREADPRGHAYWTGQLASGAMGPGQLMTHFSESSEFVSLTGTLPPEAPAPVVPADSGSGRRIIYCISCQHVWLVEDSGYLVRDYKVSGRANTPAAGTYQVFSKSPVAWAGYGGITMEYMVRYTWGRTLALGFHSIPKRPNGTFLQTEEELGQYRSAGCTRQRLEDARFLYEWAPVGTTVVVLP